MAQSGRYTLMQLIFLLLTGDSQMHHGHGVQNQDCNTLCMIKPSMSMTYLRKMNRNS